MEPCIKSNTLANDFAAPHCEFTFRSPINPVEENTPSNDITDLKQSHNHPNAPTPNSSPQKKRVHQSPDGTIHLHSLQFEPINSSVNFSEDTEPTSLTSEDITKELDDMPALADVDASDDEGDGNGNENGISDGSRLSTRRTRHLKKPKITDFWTVETPENKVQRQSRNAENMEATCEYRLVDEQAIQMKKTEHRREGVKKRQQSYRDREHAKRVDAGWEPSSGNHQKRVRSSKQLEYAALLTSGLIEAAGPSRIR